MPRSPRRYDAQADSGRARHQRTAAVGAELATDRALEIAAAEALGRALGIGEPRDRHGHEHIDRSAGDMGALPAMALGLHHRIALGHEHLAMAHQADVMVSGACRLLDAAWTEVDARNASAEEKKAKGRGSERIRAMSKIVGPPPASNAERVTSLEEFMRSKWPNWKGGASS